MSRIFDSVRRAKGQLARISDSMKNAKKEPSDAYEVHSANLTRWHTHWNDMVNYRIAVVERRRKNRENKKRATLEEQMEAFRGKMRNGLLLGAS